MLFCHSDQTIYGRVMWNPAQDLDAAYKLQIEKLFICTGIYYLLCVHIAISEIIILPEAFKDYPII